MTTQHRTRRPLPLALVLLALPACDAVDPELEDGLEDELELRSLEDGTACPADREIAEMTVEACANIGSWTGTSLFPGAPAGDLRRMCIYQWSGGGSPNTAALDAAGTVDTHGPDCVGVLEHTDDALEPELGAPLRTLFFDGVNAPRASDLSAVVAQSPVKVVVVDASPLAIAGITTRSPHGEAMVDIIASLACPLATCGVSIDRMLALPRLAGGGVDTTHGGYAGSQGDLARAIFNAVNVPGPRKIINMSVGWDPQDFGDLGDSPAVDGVYKALEYAACKSALVVAAAGNRGLSESTGPILPGGWEQNDAPTAVRCGQLGVAVGAQVVRPLVYSVGGLRYHEERMPGSREGGVPRLTAAAMHVTVGNDSPTLSGTSVSTAAVTGAAALLWAYKPTLSATQVMTQLYTAGETLGTAADYSHPSYAQTQMRRLDACDALATALGPATPHPLACKGRDPRVPGPDPIETVNDQLLATPGLVTQAPALVPIACNDLAFFAPTGSACPVPVDPATAYVLPQPTQPACPNCTLKKADMVVLASLDPEYDVELQWHVRTVEVEVTDGTSKTLYKLEAPALSSSTMTTLSLGTPPVHAIKSATISVTFQEFSRPQVNQLAVLE